VQILEVPEIVVRALCLRNLVVWLWLTCVDDVWELESILDEEDLHNGLLAKAYKLNILFSI